MSIKVKERRTIICKKGNRKQITTPMKLKIKLRNILSVKIHKIVLLLLALCIYNTAYGQNQRISVYGNNQSLQKVFEQIEEQTQLSITYNQTRLDVNRKIKGRHRQRLSRRKRKLLPGKLLR